MGRGTSRPLRKELANQYWRAKVSRLMFVSPGRAGARAHSTIVVPKVEFTVNGRGKNPPAPRGIFRARGCGRALQPGQLGRCSHQFFSLME